MCVVDLGAQITPCKGVAHPLLGRIQLFRLRHLNYAKCNNALELLSFSVLASSLLFGFPASDPVNRFVNLLPYQRMLHDAKDVDEPDAAASGFRPYATWLALYVSFPKTVFLSHTYKL